MLILFVRSLLCNICYMIFLGLGVPFMCLGQKLFTRNVYKEKYAWFNFLFFCCNLFAKLKYEVRGDFPSKEQCCIFASKHQSALEIYIFHRVLKSPAFIVKKELFSIPFFNNFIRYYGGFSVDRENGIKAIREMKKGLEKFKKVNKRLVVFPEGTRTPVGENGKILPGVYMFYKMGLPIVPVALNTGKFWAKNSFLRKPGKITIQFLPPIEEKNLTQEQFMERLNKDINGTSLQLV